MLINHIKYKKPNPEGLTGALTVGTIQFDNDIVLAQVKYTDKVIEIPVSNIESITPISSPEQLVEHLLKFL